MDYLYLNYIDKELDIKREDMPQIDVEFIPDVIFHFIGKGIKINMRQRMLKKIKPTQSEFNEEKILKKIQKGDKQYLRRRYLLSNDGYLADGHHDWATGLEDDESVKVTTIFVDLPIKELIKRLKKLKLSYKKDINDEIKKSLEAIKIEIENSSEVTHIYKAKGYVAFSKQIIQDLLKKGHKDMVKSFDRIQTTKGLKYIKYE